jgi:hypothetical protein
MKVEKCNRVRKASAPSPGDQRLLSVCIACRSYFFIVSGAGPNDGASVQGR